jgi:hypothetical protein
MCNDLQNTYKVEFPRMSDYGKLKMRLVNLDLNSSPTYDGVLDLNSSPAHDEAQDMVAEQPDEAQDMVADQPDEAQDMVADQPDEAQDHHRGLDLNLSPVHDGILDLNSSPAHDEEPNEAQDMVADQPGEAQDMVVDQPGEHRKKDLTNEERYGAYFALEVIKSRDGKFQTEDKELVASLLNTSVRTVERIWEKAQKQLAEGQR